MKKIAFFMVFAAGFALLGSSAFGQIIYTANNSPGTTNDSLVDGGPETTQAWTLVATGGAGAFLNTIDGTNVWDIYDNTYTDGGGTVTQTNNFVDGALQVDQSVSIEYGIHLVASDTTVGLNLLSGSATEASVYFLGGGEEFLYTDSTHTATYTGQGYVENTLLDFSFEVTGADTYSADLNLKPAITRGRVKD